jgi:RNA polymerase sigma-70 factor (ECF subfamily)
MEGRLAIPLLWALGPEETRPAAADPDSAIAVAAAGGDRAAFTRLVEKHQRAVYGLAIRLLGRGRESDARDAAQDAFLRAWSSLKRYDPERPFKVWLLAIARNRCLDALRRRGHDFSLAEDEVEVPVVAVEPHAVEALERRDLEAAVAAAMETLPPRQRAALALFHKDGLSTAEIAEVMGVPLGTVLTWMHRGRNELRKKLEAFS